MKAERLVRCGFPGRSEKKLKGGDSMTQEEFRTETALSREAGCRKLFEEYCGYVYTIVFNRLRSCARREDIDECVSDIFADVFLYFDKDGGFDGDMSGFVGTVAKRKASDYYSRLARPDRSVSMDSEEVMQLSSGSDVEKKVTDSDTQGIVIDKIKQLGEPDSTIIIQRYYYEMSSKEVAAKLGMTPAAVRVRSRRAVKKLRTMLRDTGIIL